MSQYLPHSYNNNIVMIKPFLFFFIILLFSFSLKTLVVVADNPLVELSSREELINVAGYGETKLSTVLVIGTLVCEEASSSLDIGKPQLNSYPLSGLYHYFLPILILSFVHAFFDPTQSDHKMIRRNIYRKV